MPKTRQELALVLGRVRAPEVLLGDRRGAEVGVVEDRPVVAGGGQRGRQVRLPDALGEPGAARPAAERRLELVAPSGAAGRSGRARAGRRGPARSSRRRGSRPGRARRARRRRAMKSGRSAPQPLEQRAACSGATGGRRGGARGPRASAGRPGRRPRRRPSRSCRPAGGCGASARARCAGPRSPSRPRYGRRRLGRATGDAGRRAGTAARCTRGASASSRSATARSPSPGA